MSSQGTDSMKTKLYVVKVDTIKKLQVFTVDKNILKQKSLKTERWKSLYQATSALNGL